MTVASALGSYIDEISALPADTLLGVIALYTIKESSDGKPVDYDRQTIADLLDSLGMDPELLPKPDNPVNDWKAATGGVNEYSYPMPNSIGTARNTGIILARRLTKNRDGVSRLFVREIRNEQSGTLSHDTVMEAKFRNPSKRSGRREPGTERVQVIINSAVLVPGERPWLEKIKAKIEADYERLSKTISPGKVRQMVRNALRDMGATPLRQSVWFARLELTDEIRKLRDLLVALDCELDRIPLLKLAEARMMLIRAVEEDTVDELRKLVQEIAHVRATRKTISPAAYAQMKRKYDVIVQQAMDYTEWLDTTLDSTGGAVDLAVESLAAMQSDMLKGGQP